MNSLNDTDTRLAHTFKNWEAKHTPPAYVRARVLRQAGSNLAGSKAQQFGRSLLVRIRSLNPYWTGRPLSHAELAKWLFSRAMMDCLSIDRSALRLVC